MTRPNDLVSGIVIADDGVDDNSKAKDGNYIIILMAECDLERTVTGNDDGDDYYFQDDCDDDVYNFEDANDDGDVYYFQGDDDDDRQRRAGATRARRSNREEAAK